MLKIVKILERLKMIREDEKPDNFILKWKSINLIKACFRG